DIIFNGSIALPDKFNFKQSSHFSFHFKNTKRLDYFENEVVVGYPEIPIIDNTGILVKPSNITIDLSESQSPGRKSIDNFWKGIYFINYKLSFDIGLDDHNQLSVFNIHTIAF